MQPNPLSMSDQPVVAIIGGGVSGAGVAYHLARANGCERPVIVVFEPRAELGRGLAYDTDDPAHRINVPAAKMSLQPDDQGEFQAWIEARDAVACDPQAKRPDGLLFPQRRLFGDYVASLLKPLLQDGSVRHCRTSVTHVERRTGRWLIRDESGGVTQADIVAIATSHPPPAAPGRLATRLAAHPRFVADTTKPGALQVIRSHDRVLVIGNGLTAADVIASLAERGHHGQVTAISRRGLRSRGHAPVPQPLFGDFLSDAAHSAVSLLTEIRAAIRAAEAQGISWHGVIDQVRAQGYYLWQAMPVAERCRLVRHLRPYWDVHRFRIAPQVEAVLDAAIAAGRLEILAGLVADARIEGELVVCTLQPRHRRQSLEQSYDAVVVTTGPAHGGILETQPWLAALAARGHLSLDPTGLGLACTERSEAIGPSGKAEPSLLISGPLARGTFGELMGLPQVTEHAFFVAGEIAAKLRLAATNAQPV
ncbi:FAD/NAD(P)-binding protein [Rhizobium bangladeshense]|uniref:FAD/NAD(P)-binding protein n=1 Tax=Rhizobium bangladeshense TaxID=1138189 RepID=A0ABS7LDU7_9HYPH|nr:FAD/NAD(P)-binding protein [Rhizobium bangladeshense]MBX4865745.1 SidA/IucD/PvdA family monooxygenase [Rhizobium bangladeshense]MBX4872367.1 SidA/IucD/PvdA family monooxygenase [Rhizobium bangladeshense]MBX4882327.1 SidA/IucD/PvdA family monooxygenase [Rhizobium bangladeshense]MBX4932566.1 SidA/IucD/PvdA family monooxygenase [Rhizobium bangladeshense]MBY3579864.1 FAD/NAD(P)-binding protein [Rhizobium bangladeshense]